MREESKCINLTPASLKTQRRKDKTSKMSNNFYETDVLAWQSIFLTAHRVCGILSSLKSNPWRFMHMDFLQDSTAQTRPTSSSVKTKAAWAMFRNICCLAARWFSIFSWVSVMALALLTTLSNISCAVNHAISGTGIFSTVMSVVCAIIGQDEKFAARLLFAFGALFAFPLLTCA